MPRTTAPSAPPTPCSPPTPPPSWRRLGRQLGPFGALGGGATLLPPAAGLLVLGTLDVVGPWLAAHSTVGLGIYVGAFAILAALALLPTYSGAILGGWALGFTLGFPAAMLGFCGAAWLAHGIARTLAGPGVAQAVAERPRWQAVQQAFVGQGFWRTMVLVAMLRLPPVAPFALINVTLAGIGVKLAPFLLGTLLGMMPRTALAVFAAAGVAHWRDAERPGSGTFLLGAAATIAAALGLTWIGRRAMRSVAAAGGGSSMSRTDPPVLSDVTRPPEGVPRGRDS